MVRQVHYLRSLDGLEDLEGDRYIANGNIRSIVTKDAVYKDCSGFRGDIDLAYSCLKIWKDLGYSGAPSSPVSFFRKSFGQKGIIKASVNNILRPFFTGGWAESFIRGSVLGNVYHYDIKKAYLWASTKGYPKIIYPVTSYNYNNYRGWIGIFKQFEPRPELPLGYKSKIILATSEDKNNYGLKGRLIHGYGWNSLSCYPTVKIMDFQGLLPDRAFKILSSGFWGIWVQSDPLDVIYRTGTKRKLYNWIQNYVWATLTVSRVKQKVWNASRGESILVSTDAIVTRDQINTGSQIGDFQLESFHEDGIFVKSSGVWTSINKRSDNLSNWFRHAGYS